MIVRYKSIDIRNLDYIIFSINSPIKFSYLRNIVQLLYFTLIERWRYMINIDTLWYTVLELYLKYGIWNEIFDKH